MIEVTFRSLGRSARQWSAIFNLGAENALTALRVAFSHNAKIVSVREVQP
jgi:hypothetical protein